MVDPPPAEESCSSCARLDSGWSGPLRASFARAITEPNVASAEKLAGARNCLSGRIPRSLAPAPNSRPARRRQFRRNSMGGPGEGIFEPPPEIFMDLGSTPSNESCRLIVWARPKDAGVCNDSYFLSNSSAREVVFSDRLQRGCPKTRNPGALVPQEAVRELLGDGEVARALVFLHRSKKVVGGTAHFLLVPLRNYSWTFCPPRAMKVAAHRVGSTEGRVSLQRLTVTF